MALKYIGLRRRVVNLVMLLLMAMPLIWCWGVLDTAARALLPSVQLQDLQHFRKNRSLKHYLDNIQLLIEPSSPCVDHDIPLLALVSSSPDNFEARDAIRKTWGKELPTFFLLGLNGYQEDDLTTDNYLEAKMNHDVIIYQFRDHYQNLTLKTALMLQWSSARCPAARFLLKTDDDVLVNPWAMRRIVEGSYDSLIGYRKEHNKLHRVEYSKWYIPRWLLAEDYVPEYLSGTGYLINGKHIDDMLQAAHTVPLINLEDVYFTYLVAKLKLHLQLSHDRRLSPYRPWLPSVCLYWGLASIHSLSPKDIISWGEALMEIGTQYESGNRICDFYE
ncbi:unnamed protein product, partial [Leptidea sinapis]